MLKEGAKSVPNALNTPFLFGNPFFRLVEELKVSGFYTIFIFQQAVLAGNCFPTLVEFFQQLDNFFNPAGVLL